MNRDPLHNPGATLRATLAQGSADDDGLTVAQYAEQHGISTDAVRRRLKAGDLVGHQRPTKHGMSWCIHPDEPPGSRNGLHEGGATLAPESRQGSATVAPGSVDTEAEGEQSEEAPTVPALAQAEAMAAYTRSILEPLVTALESSQTRVSELERENGVLSERVDGLTHDLERVQQESAAISQRHAAEVDALKAAQAQQEARTALKAAEPSSDTPNALSDRVWLALLALVVVIAVIALVAWPR